MTQLITIILFISWVLVCIDTTTDYLFDIKITGKTIKETHTCINKVKYEQFIEKNSDVCLKNIELLEMFKWILFIPKMNLCNTFCDVVFSDTKNEKFTTFKIFVVNLTNANFLLRNFVLTNSEKYIEQFQNMLDDSSFENMIFVCCKSDNIKDEFYKHIRFFDKINFINILKNFNRKRLETNTWYELCCGFEFYNTSDEEILDIYKQIYKK